MYFVFPPYFFVEKVWWLCTYLRFRIRFCGDTRGGTLKAGQVGIVNRLLWIVISCPFCNLLGLYFVYLGVTGEFWVLLQTYQTYKQGGPDECGSEETPEWPMDPNRSIILFAVTIFLTRHGFSYLSSFFSFLFFLGVVSGIQWETRSRTLQSRRGIWNDTPFQSLQVTPKVPKSLDRVNVELETEMW